MRLVTLFVLSSSVACTPDAGPMDFAYRSTLARETAGLELHYDGERGHAGMFNSNCPFETKNGTVTGDFDLPGSGEWIQDAESTVLGEITVAAVLGDDVHVLDKTDGVYTHVPVSAPGVVEARLLFDGVVTLHRDCSVQTRNLDGEVLGTTLLSGCERADFEVDPLTGTTFVARGANPILLTGNQRIDLESDADLVSWDPAMNVFYVAVKGSSVVEALEPDGVVRWSVETPGPVHSLDDGGEANGVAVVMEQPDGRGWIALYDGETGDESKRGITPSTADALSVSGNGRVIALVRPDQTYFYDIL